MFSSCWPFDDTSDIHVFFYYYFVFFCGVGKKIFISRVKENQRKSQPSKTVDGKTNKQTIGKQTINITCKLFFFFFVL